ncbi:MAG: tRNA (guanosine(46)-N7)-methyltransferase TrmB [Salibacteraceae bacterium]
MSGKNKQAKFTQFSSYTNTVEPETEFVRHHDHDLKGQWGSRMFGNDRPIVLELGCGKGEYSVGLARKYPEKNFIGVDIKGNRMWRGAKTANEEGISNIAFLRTRIEFISSLFGSNEVSEIWITFPDPQLKEQRMKKRLTHPVFLDNYSRFLKPDGLIHLKTDSAPLHYYTLEVIQEGGHHLLEATDDLYGRAIQETDPDTREILSIRTHYETLFSQKGFAITYLKFQLHQP